MIDFKAPNASNVGVIPKSFTLLCKISFVFGHKWESPLPLTSKPRFFS